MPHTIVGEMENGGGGGGSSSGIGLGGSSSSSGHHHLRGGEPPGGIPAGSDGDWIRERQGKKGFRYF